MQARADPRSLIIVAWLAVQVGLPLRYYLGDDPFDERFAWRMYSEVRGVRCDPAFEADGAPVALNRRYQVAWIRLARRARMSVVEAMASDLCKGHDQVRLSLRCRHPDGGETVVEDGAREQCRAER